MERATRILVVGIKRSFASDCGANSLSGYGFFTIFFFVAPFFVIF